jgi:hypothetical protein
MTSIFTVKPDRANAAGSVTDVTDRIKELLGGVSFTETSFPVCAGGLTMVLSVDNMFGGISPYDKVIALVQSVTDDYTLHKAVVSLVIGGGAYVLTDITNLLFDVDGGIRGLRGFILEQGERGVYLSKLAFEIKVTDTFSDLILNRIKVSKPLFQLFYNVELDFSTPPPHFLEETFEVTIFWFGEFLLWVDSYSYTALADYVSKRVESGDSLIKALASIAPFACENCFAYGFGDQGDGKGWCLNCVGASEEQEVSHDEIIANSLAYLGNAPADFISDIRALIDAHKTR